MGGGKTSGEIRNEYDRLLFGHPIWLASSLIVIGVFGIILSAIFEIQLLDKIGMAIFSAGVFSVFFKSMQAAGVFSDELAKIIFFDPSNSGYLRRRNDLPYIWFNVTRAFHGDGFPALDDKITEYIRETYLPLNFDYYLEGITVNHKIEWHDKPNNIAKIITLVEGRFIPNKSKSRVTYALGYATKTVPGISKQHQWSKLMFYGKDFLQDNNFKEDQDIGEDGGIYVYKCSLNLPNNGPCAFKGENFFYQNVVEDNTFGYWARSYVDALTVDITFPHDSMKILFGPFGTRGDFENVGFQKPGSIRKQYKGGLLFAYQGYASQMILS